MARRTGHRLACTTTQNQPTGVTCIDYEKGYSAGTAQQSCPTNGTYAAAACPTDNRIGHCMVVRGCEQFTVSYYAPTTLIAAQSMCGGMGLKPGSAAFTPG